MGQLPYVAAANDSSVVGPVAVVGSTGLGEDCEQDDPLQDEQKTCSVRLMAMMMRSARLAASTITAERARAQD